VEGVVAQPGLGRGEGALVVEIAAHEVQVPIGRGQGGSAQNGDQERRPDGGDHRMSLLATKAAGP
jgi:hypothetical protein